LVLLLVALYYKELTDVHLFAGTHMVFFVLNIVEALGLLMMFKPFLVEKKKMHTNQLH